MCGIQYRVQTIKLGYLVPSYIVSMSLLLKFTVLFAGHQGSSQSDHPTITGFSFFKLLNLWMATESVEPLPYVHGVQPSIVVGTCCMWAWKM